MQRSWALLGLYLASLTLRQLYRGTHPPDSTPTRGGGPN